jgi:hypothetical protein
VTDPTAAFRELLDAMPEGTRIELDGTPLLPEIRRVELPSFEYGDLPSRQVAFPVLPTVLPFEPRLVPAPLGEWAAPDRWVGTRSFARAVYISAGYDEDSADVAADRFVELLDLVVAAAGVVMENIAAMVGQLAEVFADVLAPAIEEMKELADEHTVVDLRPAHARSCPRHGPLVAGGRCLRCERGR